MKANKIVTMEPELEAIAGDWSAEKRLSNARKMRRWASQLEISALIIAASLNRRPTPRRHVKAVPLKLAVLN